MSFLKRLALARPISLDGATGTGPAHIAALRSMLH
jgi:hypothetical protein